MIYKKTHKHRADICINDERQRTADIMVNDETQLAAAFDN